MSPPRRPVCSFPLLLGVLLHLALGIPLGADDSAGGQELDRWLATSAAGRRYRSVGEDLVALAADADRDGLPSAVLVERLKEGAAKSVTPEALVAAGRAELGRLSVVAGLLGEVGMATALHTPADAERAFTSLSLCLRAGLSAEGLAELLGGAVVYRDGVERGLSACEALLKLTGATRLEEEDLVRLGGMLLAGKVPPAAYGSITAIFVKGRAGRLDDSETLSIVAGVLERGGGMIQINEAVDAETRRRSRAR